MFLALFCGYSSVFLSTDCADFRREKSEPFLFRVFRVFRGSIFHLQLSSFSFHPFPTSPFFSYHFSLFSFSLPIVLHIGKSRWHAPRKLSQLQEAPKEIWELYGEFLPECGYFLIDLSPSNDGKLPDDPVARAVLSLLQAEKEGTLMEQACTIFGELGEHPSVQKFRDTIGKMCEFVLQKNPLQREELMDKLKGEIAKPVEEVMLSTYDQLINEGFEIGLEKGIEKGRQEERVASRLEMIFAALRIKFGKVPQKLADSIRKISESDRLQELLLVAIRSQNLKEFSSHLR